MHVMDGMFQKREHTAFVVVVLPITWGCPMLYSHSTEICGGFPAFAGPWLGV